MFEEDRRHKCIFGRKYYRIDHCNVNCSKLLWCLLFAYFIILYTFSCLRIPATVAFHLLFALFPSPPWLRQMYICICIYVYVYVLWAVLVISPSQFYIQERAQSLAAFTWGRHANCWSDAAVITATGAGSAAACRHTAAGNRKPVPTRYYIASCCGLLHRALPFGYVHIQLGCLL